MRIEKVAAASSIIRATKTMIVQFMNDIGHETFALGDNASQVKFDDEFWAILAGVDIVPNFNWEMICKWTGGNKTVGKMIAQEVYKTEPPRDGVNVNVWQDCGLAQAGHPDHRWRLIVFLILSPSIKQRVRFQEMRKLFSRFPTPGSLLRNVDEFKRFLHGRCSKHASRAEAIIRTTKKILVQFLYEAGWKSFALADDESQVQFAEDFWRDIEHVDIVPSFKWTKIRKWRGVGPKTANRIAREVFNREPPGAVQNFRESWRKWVMVDSTHPSYHWRLIVLLITSISMSDQVLPHQMEELFAEFPDPKTLLSDTEGFKSFMSGRCRYFSTVASSVIRTTKQMIVQYLQEAGWDAFCLADNDGQAVFPEDFWATLTDVDILPRYDWNKVRSWYGVGQKVGSLIAWEVYHEKHAIPVDRHVRRFLLTHWLGRAEMTVDVLAATAGKSISANDYMRVNEAIANIAQILYKSDRNNVLLTEVKVKLIKTLADISEEFDQRCQMRDFIYFYCQI
jgi:endonuclease III